jgi:hypothetical protein
MLRIREQSSTSVSCPRVLATIVLFLSVGGFDEGVLRDWLLQESCKINRSNFSSTGLENAGTCVRSQTIAIRYAIAQSRYESISQI